MPKQAAGSNTSVDSVIKNLIADIDSQISQLEKKKAALVSAFGGVTAVVATATGVRRRGRPPGSTNKKGKKAAPAEQPAAKKGRKRRKFSAETKAKLAASKKAYWDRIRAEKAGKGK